MRKIKIFTFDINYGYDDDPTAVFREGITDWEEVTEEDYMLILNNLWRLRNRIGNRDEIVIVEQRDNYVPVLIKDIKDHIQKEIVEAEKRDQAAKLKKEREAAERARKKAEKEQKKLLEDREALAKLIEENPDLIKDVIENINHGEK